MIEYWQQKDAFIILLFCKPCRHIANKVLRQRISVKSVEGKDEEARQGGVGGVVPAI